MSTVLHPEGPEEPRTYWMRRGISVGVVVLLVLIVALIWPNGDTSQTASPQPAGNATESVAISPTPEPAGSAAASATATANPTSEATPTTKTESKPADSTPTTSTPDKTESTRKAKAAGEPELCAPKDLKVSVSGPSSVRAAKSMKFDVSVTNAGKQDCELDIGQKNFELRVYSGKDKIFTTDHCWVWAPDEAGVLAPGAKLEWQTSWGVNRTAKECKTSKQLLRPGTYVATAELDKAKPAQHVMRLK